MTALNFSVLKHQEIHHITSVGAAIGNALLVRALYDESQRYWDRAVNQMTGDHLIMGLTMSSEMKSTAISDYALVLSTFFINSKYPSMALFSKHAYSTAPEHRKSVIYRLAARRFNDNTELFRAIVTELLCFDPYVVNMALDGVGAEFFNKELVGFISSMLGDLLSPDDWGVTQEELVDTFAAYDFVDNREVFINACLAISTGTEAVSDFYQLLTTAIGNVRA